VTDPVLPTVAAFVHSLAGDERVRLRFDDESWTGDEWFRAAAQRASFFAHHLDPAGPPHVGVLLDNVPDYAFALAGAALIGAAVVGVNPTRRGAELARDIAHTECQLLLTDRAMLDLFDDAGVPLPPERVFVIDDPDWADVVSAYGTAAGNGSGTWPAVDPRGLASLIFTSGTTSAPKAVRMSQVRWAGYAMKLAEINNLGRDDVMYGPMPLFHSNALITAFAPALHTGSQLVLVRKFSASRFVDDMWRYGVTYANYVGKVLSYVLAQPARPDDHDVPLRRVFGNEAAAIDCERFAARFGCEVRDGYGSTEGGVAITRTPESPDGSLGLPSYGTVAILDPDSGAECERARFDADGRIVNAEAAIGEIVGLDTAAGFEGYYNDPSSTAERVHDDRYWSGDLGYRDEAGFFYFAGRTGDWLRVDGENFAGAPVERIIDRFAAVLLSAVYGVPDALAGDQVMAALLLREGPASFDPVAFATFLDAQSDLGTKWAPRYVRLVDAFPQTETQKIIKRVLQAAQWAVSDPVWWRPTVREPYRLLDASGRSAIRDEFERHRRVHLLALNP
jgi:fatty-acyl-CoA synthase